MAILEEETYKKFGHYPSSLSHSSHKRIIVVCDNCGVIREISKKQYRSLCLACSKKGIPLSAETRKKISNSNCGEKNHNWKPKVKCFCLECGKEFSLTLFRIENGGGKYCSNSCRGKAYIRQKKFPHHHTKPEHIFEDICKRNNINFQYTGDGTLWIGKKGEKQLNPDFIEGNGKKVLIEVMGDYWHSPLLNRSMKEHGTLDFRKKHYRRYKWNPIFIWESDLKRKDAEEFVLNVLQKQKVI